MRTASLHDALGTCINVRMEGQPCFTACDLFCGQLLMKESQVVYTSWHSCPYIIPFPWLWAGPNDLLLTDRLWGKLCHFLRLSYKKLQFPYCSLSLQLFTFACSDNKRHILWAAPSSTHGQESFLPPASKELRSNNCLGTESYQQPCAEFRSFPSWALRWPQLWLASLITAYKKKKTQLSYTRMPNLKAVYIINDVLRH